VENDVIVAYAAKLEIDAAGRPKHRAWRAAIAWKEFQIACGGMPIIKAKCCLYGLLTLLYCAARSNWELGRIDLVSVGESSTELICLVLLPLELTLSSARLFYAEVREQTLGTLVLLPLSIQRIAYGKVAGALVALFPALAGLALAGMMAPDALRDIAWDVTGVRRWTLQTTVAVLVCVVLFLHQVAYSSLRMSPWWAVFAAVVVQSVGMWGIYRFLTWNEKFSVFLRLAEFTRQWGISNLMIILGLILILLFHRGIGTRVRLAAAEE
jgi:hypothetical protein